MTKSNQPDRGLHHEASTGFPLSDAMMTEDDDLGLDAIGTDQTDAIGKHRPTGEQPAGAPTLTKANAKTAKGQQSTQRTKQGNQPDIR